MLPPTGDFGTLTGQQNGIFGFYSKTTIASITDGTSNTMLTGELAWGTVESRRSGLLVMVGLGELGRLDVLDLLSPERDHQRVVVFQR